MARHYYHEKIVQDFLKARGIIAPPVDKINKHFVVDLETWRSYPDEKIDRLLRVGGFWQGYASGKVI